MWGDDHGQDRWAPAEQATAEPVIHDSLGTALDALPAGDVPDEPAAWCWDCRRLAAAGHDPVALAALEDLSEPLEPGPEGEELAELRPVEALPGHAAPTALDHLVRVFGTAAAELDGDVLAVPNGEGLSRYRASEAAEILARFAAGYGSRSTEAADHVWEALSACRVEAADAEPWDRPASEIAQEAYRRFSIAQSALTAAVAAWPGPHDATAVEARRLGLLAAKLEEAVREARALRRLSTQDEESQPDPPAPPPPGDPLDR